MRERASIVLVHQGRLLTVRLEDPKSRVVRDYVPGGAVEEGESPAAAAAREALEETGYQVIVDEESRRVLEYDFEWAGGIIPCRTHFFRARLALPAAPPRLVQDASFHRGVGWLPLAEIPRAFGYHQKILKEILALIGEGVPPHD